MIRSTSSPVTRWAQALETDRRLEPLSSILQRLASFSLRNTDVKAALQGRAAGHAIHPALVDFPLGSLTSALVLDLVQGARAADASRVLVATATISLAPSAATGLAEWADADDRTQRVGAAHAALNLVGGVLTAGSWLARARGHWKSGVWLSSAALTALSVSAYLGGHMTLVRKYATHDAPADLAGATSGVRPSDS